MQKIGGGVTWKRIAALSPMLLVWWRGQVCASQKNSDT